MDNRSGRCRHNRSGVPPSGRFRRTRSGPPYLICSIGARKHNIADRAVVLARAHSDLIVGVFAAGQPIHTDTECRGGERRKTDRRRRSVSGRRIKAPEGLGSCWLSEELKEFVVSDGGVEVARCVWRIRR
ncbi:hypothetical protein LR48_Vigan01g152500 [Vigna angularis]|uniref:Uncharacterized protein n=1 Tax=Phaseolus angularis TaxID=3914 RepID=A0A0L9TPB2_PHAAN|nr:hypothetical protein LR48_Vigan01g152500 [Vigna angularis]